MEDNLSRILEKVSQQAILSKDQLIRDRLRVLLEKLKEFEPIMVEIKKVAEQVSQSQEDFHRIQQMIQEKMDQYGLKRVFLLTGLESNNAMSIQVDDEGYFLGLNPDHPAVQKRSLTSLKELFHELVVLALLEELKTKPIKTLDDLAEQKDECLYPDDRFSYPQLADIILNTYLGEE